MKCCNVSIYIISVISEVRLFLYIFVDPIVCVFYRVLRNSKHFMIHLLRYISHITAFVRNP